jgi:hypoxanthine phosphoribosyltransferase
MPITANLVFAIVGVGFTLVGIGLSYRAHRQQQGTQEKLRKTQQKLQEAQSELKAEVAKRKRITWAELPKRSRSLRDDFEGDFSPDLIITPGLRGGTILNLMYGVKENKLTYTGFREDTRWSNQLDSRPRGYMLLNETSDYRHYLPEGVTEEPTDQKILILDDYAKTGESLRKFRKSLIELGFDSENIKTASIVCSETVTKGGEPPDYYSLSMPSGFDFPWGEAI